MQIKLCSPVRIPVTRERIPASLIIGAEQRSLVNPAVGAGLDCHSLHLI